MAEEVLRNKNGQIIGRIKEEGGYFVIRDASGKILGRYNPRDNTTRDSSGRIIGRGNLLVALLKKGF